ncbi:MAG: hypothetical protein ACOH2M_27120, partial [Cypionkella sp.]
MPRDISNRQQASAAAGDSVTIITAKNYNGISMLQKIIGKISNRHKRQQYPHTPPPSICEGPPIREGIYKLRESFFYSIYSLELTAARVITVKRGAAVLSAVCNRPA